MAKKNAPETRTSIDNLNDSLTSLGQKVQANQKVVLWVCIVVAFIVAAIIVFVFFIRKPAINDANNAVGAADYELIFNQNDSTALALYQQAAEEGYAAGNRAKLMAAIKLYEAGQYAEALGYLDDYSAKDDVIGAAAYSLKGDCLVNLAFEGDEIAHPEKLAEAVDAFKDAIKQSDKNPYYTPFFMQKLARVYMAQQNYAGASELYGQILSDYPQYVDAYGFNIEKDKALAEEMAASK